MVQLTIVSTRGNAVRWYPVTGFLGLTDVKVEGIVRTRLEDDQRHLAATSIDVSVRCYEERIGKTGPTSRPTVLAEFAQTLWQKQPGRASEPVGDKDLPFHITIPKRNKGASVMNFQTYRVFWRVEATCHHMPMIGLGTRQCKAFELALVRYDSRRLSSSVATTPFLSARAKKRAVSVDHQIQLPNNAIGPLDIIPITVRLRPMGDDGARVGSLSLALHRRIGFHDPPPPNASREDLPALRPQQRTSAPAEDSSSLLVEQDDLSPPNSAALLPKASSMVVATTEATSIGIDDATNDHVKTLYVSLPPAKSHNHWALGESLKTQLCTIAFYVVIKATLVLSNGHQETIELPPVELIMNATNHEERQSVRDKFPELFKKAASSSTSGKPKDKTRHPIGSSSGRPGTAKGDRDRDREGESKRQGSGSSSARSRSRSRARDEHSRHDKPKSAGAEEMPMPSVGAISAPSSAVAPRQRKSRRPHTAGGDSSRRPLLSGGENEQPPPLSPVLRKSSREQPSSGTQPIPIPIPSTPTPTQHRSQSHGSSTTSLALPITPRSTSSVNLVSISGAAAAVVSPLDSKPESDLARSTAKASDVLAWEAELERIEARSRQRTVQMASSPGAASRKTLFVSVSPT